MIRKKLWLLLRERNTWKFQKEVSAVFDPFCEHIKLLSSALLFKVSRLGIQRTDLVSYRRVKMLHVEYKKSIPKPAVCPSIRTIRSKLQSISLYQIDLVNTEDYSKLISVCCFNTKEDKKVESNPTWKTDSLYLILIKNTTK